MPVETEVTLEYRYYTILGATGTVRYMCEADEQTPSNITHLGYGNVGWAESSRYQINGREWCVVKDSDADLMLHRMCGKVVVVIEDLPTFEQGDENE